MFHFIHEYICVDHGCRAPHGSSMELMVRIPIEREIIVRENKPHDPNNGNAVYARNVNIFEERGQRPQPIQVFYGRIQTHI